MSDHDPLKTLWTSQKDDPMTLNDADIRARAQKFDATIGWRNAREYAAAIIVVLFFGYFAATDTNPVKQAGAALIVLAALFVSWRLAAHASPGAHADPASPWLDRYRGELVRQRDMLKTVWRWYALPFVPGLALMMAARHVYPEFALHQAPAWQSLALPLAFVGAIFGGVLWLNHVAAKKLQSDIDELDRANRG
jgi:hypothetical protein